MGTRPSLPALSCRLSESDTSDVTPTVHSIAEKDLQSEVERLRAENEGLRAANLQLQTDKVEVLHASIGDMEDCPTPELPENVFDDPFEPPLGSTSWIMRRSPSLSCKSSNTDADTELHSMMWGMASNSSGWQSECTSLCASGGATPVQHTCVPHPSCAMVSAWFPFVPTTTGMIDVS